MLKRKKKKNKLQKSLKKSKQLKAKIDEITVELTAKSGEGGRLFGSITSKQIAEELQKKHNIKIDKRKIELEDAIRALGVYKGTCETSYRSNSYFKCSCKRGKVFAYTF